MQKMSHHKPNTAKSHSARAAVERLAREVNEHEAAARRTGDDRETYLADLCRARRTLAEQRLAVAS